jgi:ABC-type iron transport system FetAB ATPase subunit
MLARGVAYGVPRSRDRDFDRDRDGEMTAVLEGKGLVVVREGRRILDGASIQVQPGEAVAIQGPPGSGKSTLARALATLVETDEGTVLLDGQEAREIAPTQFRTRVAFLGDE